MEKLERFCAGFADRDTDAIMRVVAPGAAVTVVTSEQPLLRGADKLRAFLDHYVEGPTTYSWEWHRHDVVIRDAVGWLLAEGVETATDEHGEERHAIA
ncbi:MAG: nuclear transport factor 2 family protein [Actinomycetota bacterium]|nr:nuclear transport factor 2 family protein [Actinomycetota bacterium]